MRKILIKNQNSKQAYGHGEGSVMDEKRAVLSELRSLHCSGWIFFFLRAKNSSLAKGKYTLVEWHYSETWSQEAEMSHCSYNVHGTVVFYLVICLWECMRLLAGPDSDACEWWRSKGAYALLLANTPYRLSPLKALMSVFIVHCIFMHVLSLFWWREIHQFTHSTNTV